MRALLVATFCLSSVVDFYAYLLALYRRHVLVLLQTDALVSVQLEVNKCEAIIIANVLVTMNKTLPQYVSSLQVSLRVKMYRCRKWLCFELCERMPVEA